MIDAYKCQGQNTEGEEEKEKKAFHIDQIIFRVILAESAAAAFPFPFPLS